MAHNRGFRGSDRPAVKYAWSTFGASASTQAIPGKILGSAGSNATVPLTQVRARGIFGCQLDPGALVEMLIVRAGLVKVSGDAFAAGVGSVPGPGSDRSEDWVWTGQLFLSSGDDAQINSDWLDNSLSIDSKAMRKFRVGETLAFVVEVIAAEMVDQAGSLNFVYAVDLLDRTN